MADAPLTSKQGSIYAIELRNMADYAEKHSPNISSVSLAALRGGAAEIERLQEWQKKLIAEHVEAYREVSDENERLRAALGRIAGLTYGENPMEKFHDGDNLRRIAREALRPTDETKDG